MNKKYLSILQCINTVFIWQKVLIKLKKKMTDDGAIQEMIDKGVSKDIRIFPQRF